MSHKNFITKDCNNYIYIYIFEVVVMYILTLVEIIFIMVSTCVCGISQILLDHGKTIVEKK